MRNSLKNNFAFLIIIFSSGTGCRKDTPTPIEPEPPSGCPEDWCYDLPPDGGLGYQYTSTGAQYLAPCFNPNNPDEFVFLRTGTAPVAELVKYTISTKLATVLCSSVAIATAPQWGRQGWIVFSTTSWKVWKVKDDGTQLTQLTFDVNDQYPNFNYNGDKIIYARMKNYSNFDLDNNPDLYLEYKMMVIDLNGNFVDSVMAQHVLPGNYFQNWTTSGIDENDNIFFAGEFGGLYSGIYQIGADLDSVKSRMVASLYHSQPIGLALDIEYRDGTIFFSRFNNGLYKVNILNGSTTKIKLGCQTRYYHHLSSTEGSNKILVQRVYCTPLDNGYIDVQNEIWLLNTESCWEEKILGD